MAVSSAVILFLLFEFEGCFGLGGEGNGVPGGVSAGSWQKTWTRPELLCSAVCWRKICFLPSRCFPIIQPCFLAFPVAYLSQQVTDGKQSMRLKQEEAEGFAHQSSEVHFNFWQ